MLENAKAQNGADISPRNPWTRAQRLLTLAANGWFKPARQMLENLRYNADISEAMFTILQKKLSDIETQGQASPRIDLPCDYLRHGAEYGFNIPFRRLRAGTKSPNPFPPSLAMPRHVGVRNDSSFILDAATVLAPQINHRMRRIEVFWAHLSGCDSDAMIDGLMSQTFTGLIRLTVITNTPETLPDIPEKLSPKVISGSILGDAAHAHMRERLDAEPGENNDPLMLFVTGTVRLGATALDRVVFAARASDKLFFPLYTYEKKEYLDTTFRGNNPEGLFNSRYPFRDMQGLNFAAPAGLLRLIGLPDQQFRSLGFAARDIAFRAFTHGSYFLPLPVDKVLWIKDEDNHSQDFALYVSLCPNHWDRKKDGTFAVPKVSIYIPAYNAARYIQSAIDSVLEQDVADLEVCVCNDGSLDGTGELLEQLYGNNSQVRWVNSRNGGIGYGSNTAIRMSKSPYIGQLDSDDRLTPGAVRRLMTYLDENPEIACAYGSCERIDGNGDYVHDEYRWPEFSREKMMVTSITHHFRMFRRSAWERTERFREDIVNAIDYDIFLKLSETGPFKHIDEMMYQRRWHGDNTSSVHEGFQTTNTHRVQKETLKRLGLSRFWDIHLPDIEQPRRVTYKRHHDTQAVIFWPDYSRDNPYQQKLYSAARKSFEICAGDIDAALDALKDVPNPHQLTFHLHWLNFLLRDVTKESEAKKRCDEFLKKINKFVWKGGRFVWTIHNTISHDTQFYDLEVELSTALAKEAHALHFHCEGSVDEVAESFEFDHNKVIVAQHGNYLSVYPNFVSRETARAELGIHAQDEVILFSGQVRPYKGVEHLVTVFRRILADRPRARLLIVGEAKWNPFEHIGPALSETEKARIISSERFATNMEMQLFFNAADIAVYPYQRILTSGSLMLALSYGIPSVVPKVAMTSDVVGLTHAGALYDVDGGIDALEQATRALLDKVLSDPDPIALRASVQARAAEYEWPDLTHLLSGQTSTETSTRVNW